MANQTAPVTSGQRIKGTGATFDITIPAATAGEKIAMYIGGGAVPSTINLTNTSGPAFTRQTPPYTSGAQDNSIWDVDAVGGETTVHVVLSGDDNVSWAVYELGIGLTPVGGSNNGGGSSSDVSLDYQIRPGATTLASGNGLIVAGFSADSTVPYGTGNKWRQLGPAGHIYAQGGNQPGNGGVNMVWMSGLVDIDASHAYPQQNAAGSYAATSVWLGAGSCYAVQVLYADTSGVATNPVVPETVRENSLPGTDKSHWYLATGTNATICGYTDKPTYAPGDTVNFQVDSTGHAFHVEIYRLGYYGFETFSARNVLGCQGGYITGTVVTQPTPSVDSTTGATYCSWTSNASWAIPSDAAPGQYYALLRRTDDTTKVCSLDFIVSGSATGKVAVCLPDFTRHAYNPWGLTGDSGPRGAGGTWSGASLYQAGSDGASPDITHRAYAVDIRRPNGIVDTQPATYLTDVELGTIAFLEAQGYDLAYLSNWDLDANPSILTTAALIVVLGHHEYLTANAYDALINGRDAGVNVKSIGSNMAGWRIRFDSSDTARQRIICYKESETADLGKNPSLPGTGYDPGDTDGSAQYTGSWRDTRQIGGGVNNPDIRPDNAFFGQYFIASGPIQTTLTVPASAKSSPVWRNSPAVQALTGASTYTTLVNALGYEADYPNGDAHQPENLVNLNPYTASFTTGANAAGSTYSASVGPITLGMTLYRADSGALVCHTGVWRGWWGISRWQAGGFTGNVVDVNWQNALLSLLYDLGAVPTAPTEMQPGIDTAVTDPATGAPVGGRNAIARAYGLHAPSPGFLAFFAVN